jgi:hypothetical protein
MEESFKYDLNDIDTSNYKVWGILDNTDTQKDNNLIHVKDLNLNYKLYLDKNNDYSIINQY